MSALAYVAALLRCLCFISREVTDPCGTLPCTLRLSVTKSTKQLSLAALEVKAVIYNGFICTIEGTEEANNKHTCRRVINGFYFPVFHSVFFGHMCANRRRIPSRSHCVDHTSLFAHNISARKVGKKRRPCQVFFPLLACCLERQKSKQACSRFVQ